jgi:hypothetical protein
MDVPSGFKTAQSIFTTGELPVDDGGLGKYILARINAAIKTGAMRLLQVCN